MDARLPPAPGFFASRWRGLLHIDRLFWVEMWLLGTALNVATTFLSLVVLGLKFPLWASLAVFLSPAPWNIFLTVAVWRACEVQRPRGASFYRLASVAWLILATTI